MAGLDRLRRWLTRAETGLAAASLLLLLGLSLAQILARNLFDTGLPGADHLSRQLVLYVTFFGALLACERQRHIRIDLVAALMSEAWRARLYRPLQTLGALVCALLTDAAWRFWRDEWRYAGDAERWQSLLSLVIPAGFALLALHFVLGALLGPAEDPAGTEPR